jgi:glycosyltransferase involved in cell wall biosynthesis
MFSALAGHGTRPSNIARDILLRHRGIHVHHEWQKKTLTEDGVPDECVKVVPFPIYEFPETGSRSGALRNRFNLGSKRILSMVGFVFDRKRHDRAIEVLPHLPEDVVLCLLGGPNNPVSEKYCERLREQAKALGVESRLVITGYLCMEDLNAGLAASELVLAPYGEVSSSASICRAVACNVPIIAAKSASFVEMADGGAGIMTVDAMSTGTLIKEVLRILDDPDYAEEFRKRNREYANKYSVDSFAKTVGRWYEQCLDG